MIQGKNSGLVPKILLGIYLTLFALLAFNPVNRADWWAENMTVLGVVVVLVIMYLRGVRFSNTAYLLMSVWIFLHTIGGHFTFERVPLGPLAPLFSLLTGARNNFDRFAHFTVGFYAYPLAEYLHTRKLVNSRVVLALFAIFAIAFVAAGYEIAEWYFAARTDPKLAADFLGSQGDIWDAQKDMLSDILGAFTATAIYFLHIKPSRQLK